MKQINWGIIGCGNVTEVKSGPAFNKVPHSKLVAVMRRNAQKAEDYARRHAVPLWTTEADEIINSPDIHAVYIATPPSSHLPYVLQALHAGKHVYVEKPMALNEQEAQQMVAAAEKAAVKLVVAHYRRQLPIFLKIKHLLKQGVIGDVRMVNMKLYQSPENNIVAPSEENWRTDPNMSGGGLFHDLAPHQLDLMYYFFGDGQVIQGFALNQGRDYPAADAVTGEIWFQNGVLFSGAWCFTVDKHEVADRCDILGTRGRISFSVFGCDVEVAIDGQTQHYTLPYPAHVQQPMIEQVVAHCLNQAPNPCTPAEGAVVMRWMDLMTSLP